MYDYHTNFSSFFAKIYLTKKGFFGVEKSIIIIIAPNLKIISVGSNFTTKIPFKKGEFMDLLLFTDWVSKYNYNLTFITKNSRFKRDLYFYFDSVILNEKKRKKNNFVDILNYIKSLFSFGVFIKK
jgi:hypothetical protein